jgi:molecular chaperone GrpE
MAEHDVNGTEAKAHDPAASEAKTDADPKTLEAQLTEAQNKANEYLDGWQRARAEFANYKKRAEKENQDAFDNGAVDAFKRFLPVIDDFDRAIANVPAERQNDDLIKGFSLIHRKFLNLLDTAGIKAVSPHGEPFDPKYHDALGQDEEADVPSGHVSMVLQKGYLHGERVLRPALVRVKS